MSQPLVVAIDGPAGAGKSTISRRVAARLGSVYIDTGAMYRAVALSALRNNTPLDDAAALESLATRVRIAFGGADSRTVLLNGEDVTEAIRTPQASEAASKVSSVPGVRRATVQPQAASLRFRMTCQAFRRKQRPDLVFIKVRREAQRQQNRPRHDTRKCINAAPHVKLEVSAT